MANHFENRNKYPKETITIPSNEIWTPKLDIFHFSSSSKNLDFSNEIARITNTGEITVTFTAMVMAYCQIHGKYYPMDSHNCFLGFQYRKDYKLTVRKFTYSWATNRMGTVWNIIKPPCDLSGPEFNYISASTTFSYPALSHMMHDTNCSSDYPSTPVYPCAESYDGFDSSSMNLDMSKKINYKLKRDA